MSRLTPRTASARPVARLALASAVGLGVTALWPVSGASAVEPTRQTIQEVLHTGAPCPGGVVLQGLFYNSAGDPVRRVSINSAEGTWTNPGTGAWLSSVVVREIHTDLVTGESFSTGTNARTWLPDATLHG